VLLSPARAGYGMTGRTIDELNVKNLFMGWQIKLQYKTKWHYTYECTVHQPKIQEHNKEQFAIHI